MNSMSGEKLKGVPYTGTLPAVLAGTKAGYLHKYKIYGDLSQSGTPTPSDPIMPSECGERTENLFDKNVQTLNKYITSTGILGDSGNHNVSDYIEINPSTYYTLSNAQVVDAGSVICNAFYDNNKTFISVFKNTNDPTTTTSPSNAKYVRITTRKTLADNIMLNTGSTALPYEPYGYKLPLTSGNTPVDIYIGDDTLSTEEYIDSGTGKIYRMVGGVLTPTDPPAPFPQIPTTANSTTIIWGGQGLAPSQFDSIQEWVDTPTYKRVNGEWVADN